MTSTNSRESTPRRRQPPGPSSSLNPEAPEAESDRHPHASYNSSFYAEAVPGPRYEYQDGRYQSGYNHPTPHPGPGPGDAHPGYLPPHGWYAPAPSEEARGSYNNSPAYGWSTNQPGPSGAGPSTSYGTSGSTRMGATQGRHPGSMAQYHEYTMAGPSSRNMAAAAGWRGDGDDGPSATAGQRTDSIDGKGHGLPVDHDLHQMTEDAMKGSRKGKDRARDDDWQFGPPLNVREGMFAGKVLRWVTSLFVVICWRLSA